MAATYDEAVAELFKGPHETFVAERKRLAAELKAAGDKAGAGTLSKLGRPPLSAWAVNQLWWHARAEFEVLLETAKKMREGDLSVTQAHRDALAKLQARAEKVLTEAGNAAAPATLRRIATTLSAIAARGGFEPEPAGALTGDRDPPGFEAAGVPAVVMAHAPQKSEEKQVLPLSPTLSPEGEKERMEKALAAAAEKQRREAELVKARAEVEAIREEISALQRQVMEAEGRLVLARAQVAKLELAATQ